MGNNIRSRIAKPLTDQNYISREQALKAIDEELSRVPEGKTTARNNLERKKRLLLQSDPNLPQFYGRKGPKFETDRVQKKVRHVPGESSLLKKPEGSVWHHIIESQTGQLLFQGELDTEELKILNNHIAEKGMVLGNPRGALEELPEKLHKGGSSTTSVSEDIHKWVSKNTPKDAKWNRLTAASTLRERLDAADEMADFYKKSKHKIQQLQFSTTQIGGLVDEQLDINAPGKATRTKIVGDDLVPGWHGNFSDQILNPRRAGLPKIKKVNTGAKLRQADLAANLLRSATQGDLLGTSLTSMQLGFQRIFDNTTPEGRKAQKALYKQMGKLVQSRGAKTALKVIPGLDIALSAQESWEYMKQGKLDQAGIAALSGAIGWVPIIGDGASAALDLSNTGIDIMRMDLVSKPDAEKRKTQRQDIEAQQHLEDMKIDSRSVSKPNRLKIQKRLLKNL